jgi:methionyl-tRNA formyltransferase
MQLFPTPVKEYALSKGIEVFQPDLLKDGSFQAVLDKVQPDLIIVVAYGRILPKYILDYPKYGCINVHGSLLPKYRGAAPIQWAIANGEKVTGVTTMYMTEGLDEGDMLLKAETEICEEENAEQLYNRLAVIGGDLLIETVKLIGAGKAVAIPQNGTEATFAPIITKENGRIDWAQPAKAIHNLVRAMVQWPICYTSTPHGNLKVYRCKVIENNTPAKCGEVLSYQEEIGLIVKAKDGAIALQDIQLEGKKRMNIEEFVRGHSFEKGTVFGNS